MKLNKIIILVFLLSSCTGSPEKELYKKGEKAKASADYKEAVDNFLKSVQRAPETEVSLLAAKEGAPLALIELKDYKTATLLFKHIILNSKDLKERNDAQKQIVDIYFDKLNDYESALIEINKLLENKATEDKTPYLMKKAKAYNYLKKFYQVLVELGPVIESAKTKETLFEALLLKADANFSMKNYSEAVKVYEGLLKNFPELSIKEQVGLQLAVCLEETRDFKAAIEVLKRVKDYYPNPGFIEKKIEGLSERQKQLPGARGFKK